MKLYEKLNTEISDAIKSQSDPILLNTLRNIKAAIMNENVSLRNKPDAGIDDEGFLKIIVKLSKQRKDSIKQFAQANRSDLIKQEESELDILNAYLPKQISDQKLKEIISIHINKLNASSIKDMGRVIQSVISEVGMGAEKSKISLIVKENLI